MRVDVVTDDDDQRIDTILNVDNQRQSLKELAENIHRSEGKIILSGESDWNMK